jgi:S-adenosylmethionine decarboxylase
MASMEISHAHALSASQGTPHLTINRDATIDLDSSNAFEGKEADRALM